MTLTFFTLDNRCGPQVAMAMMTLRLEKGEEEACRRRKARTRRESADGGGGGGELRGPQDVDSHRRGDKSPLASRAGQSP